MRNTKKVISILLTLLMVVGMMSTFAFADTTYSITINNETKGHNYTGYQIFSGTLNNSEDTLSNIAWGDGVDLTEAAKTAIEKEYGSSDAKEVAKSIGNTDAGARAFAKFISNYVTPVEFVIEYNETAKKYVKSGLAAGYYLVKETGSEATEGGLVSDFIIRLVKNVAVDPKDTGDKPTINKVEKGPSDEDWVSSTSASVGDSITYKLTATLPSNLADYESYYFEMKDIMSKGLTYNLVDKIYIDNKTNDVKGEFTTSHVVDATTGVTTLTIKPNNDNNNIKSVTGVEKASTITVEYTATLNENAVTEITAAETNNVDLIYSNDPKSNGKGTISATQVNVYTYSMEVSKYWMDNTEKTPLTGAQFKLYDVETGGTAINFIETKTTTGITYRVAKSEETGATSTIDMTEFANATILGLKNGTYYLEEITAPDGFNKLTDRQVVNISNISDSTVVAQTSATTAGVENKKGSLLPSTGGIGTTIFYLIGAILVIGAGVVFVTRRRMHSEK